jgi:hypothetical protein
VAVLVSPLSQNRFAVKVNVVRTTYAGAVWAMKKWYQDNDRMTARRKGDNHGNEKSAGRMEQGLSRMQHRAQISGFLHRQESQESLGKRLQLT